MPPAPSTPLYGYHGCRDDAVTSIKTNNFRTSKGDQHYKWLGEGAYFFGEGILPPADAAKAWAIVSAWNNEERRNEYTKWAVLRATISPQKLLDITTTEGKVFIQHTHGELQKRLNNNTQRRCVGGDCQKNLIQYLVNRMKFDVIIYDFWVQLTKIERLYKVWLQFPNVRMICVFAPHTSIDKSSIVVVNNGLIS